MQVWILLLISVITIIAALAATIWLLPKYNGHGEQRIEFYSTFLSWSSDYVIQVLMGQGKKKFINHWWIIIIYLIFRGFLSAESFFCSNRCWCMVCGGIFSCKLLLFNFDLLCLHTKSSATYTRHWWCYPKAGCNNCPQSRLGNRQLLSGSVLYSLTISSELLTCIYLNLPDHGL